MSILRFSDGMEFDLMNKRVTNPLAWLNEDIFLRKEKNFFETRVPEYQTSGNMQNAREEDLI